MTSQRNDPSDPSLSGIRRQVPGLDYAMSPGVSAAHIVASPGLAQRASILPPLTARMAEHGVTVLHVVPTEMESYSVTHYMKTACGLGFDPKDPEGFVILSYQSLYLEMVGGNKSIQKLLSGSTLFVLEDPAVDRDFWADICIGHLLEWIADEATNTKHAYLGLLTLSNNEPKDWWSRTVRETLDVALKVVNAKGVSSFTETQHVPPTNKTDDGEQVTQIVANVLTGPADRPPVILCVMDQYEYRYLQCRISKQFKVSPKEYIRMPWASSNPTPPEIMGAIEAIRVLALDAFGSSAGQSSAPIIAGLDPRFSLIDPICATHVIVAGDHARPIFDEKFGGTVSAPYVQRIKHEMTQAEGFVHPACQDRKVEIHYVEGGSTTVQRDVRDALDKSMLEWLMAKAYRFPGKKMNFYLSEPVTKERGIEFSKLKLTILQCLESGPGVDEYFLTQWGMDVHNIMAICDDFRAALFLAPCLDPGMSIRVKHTIVGLATVYLTCLRHNMVLRKEDERSIPPFAFDSTWMVEQLKNPIASQAYRGGLWFILAIVWGVSSILDECNAISPDGFMWLFGNLRLNLHSMDVFGHLFVKLGRYFGVDQQFTLSNLTDGEVLEVETHLVRAFFFDLLVCQGVVNEHDASGYAFNWAALEDATPSSDTFFIHTERFAREQGGNFHAIPCRIHMSYDDDGHEAYVGEFLTGVSGIAVANVLEELAVEEWEGRRLDQLTEKPRMDQKD
ncbi:hypothetical protein B0T19DRAFT_467856 [Cercophora scortea]|uniref:Uncharacterized protein n=1 Tax=Cercophora scortea TaxID=314031 RepID=A0AAE0I7I0_9PEZI|nr:hypothetical protein B0T19DRAFT_467856 [Cercophora scortea]